MTSEGRSTESRAAFYKATKFWILLLLALLLAGVLWRTFGGAEPGTHGASGALD